MSDLVSEYSSTIKPKINTLVESALRDKVSSKVIEELQEQTEKVVYSYYSVGGLPRRREAGGIKDKGNMEVTVDGLTLIVESSVPLQNLFWSGEVGASGKADLAAIVEGGASEYHMPGVRAYHAETENEINGSTEIEGIIAEFVNTNL